MYSDPSTFLRTVMSLRFDMPTVSSGCRAAIGII